MKMGEPEFESDPAVSAGVYLRSVQTSGAGTETGTAGQLRDPAVLLQQLSAMAEDDDTWEADPAYLEYLEAKYRDVECPLFLDSLPADCSTNPQLQALQLLTYDGETPQSVAKRCREQGKEFFMQAIEAQKGKNSQKFKRKLEEAEDAYQRVNPKPCIHICCSAHNKTTRYQAGEGFRI